VAREASIEVSEWATRVESTTLDAERAKVEATRQVTVERLWAHTTCMNHSISLNKMLEEKKDHLKEKKQDLKVWEVVQVEA
jgi:hypothetical protein